MEAINLENESTCLLCYEEREIFILPKCNHKNICWRCCMKMIQGGSFECPFCKDNLHEKEMIIFVTLEQMLEKCYSDFVENSHLKVQLFKSEVNSNYFYTCPSIAEKIEYETSYNCSLCSEEFESLSQLKKHLDVKHSRQYCDICLMNRKCILSEQILYTPSGFQKHMKNGEFSDTGDLIMYHPICDFCKTSFYDIDEFRKHLEKRHQKCHHCHKHSEDLRYIYYRDYDEAERHFRKSHFICEIGDCLNAKIQNVFVSEEALQEHIQRRHRKSKKGVSDQPVMNIMLGFNKTSEEAALEWDNIGKNYKELFNKVEKHSAILKLQSVHHYDCFIDIRDFYSERVKLTCYWTLKEIQEKALDCCYSLKSTPPSSITLDSVDMFKPLDAATSFSRADLERFLHRLFSRRIASLLVEKFFQGRTEFKSVDDYFDFIRNKMVSESTVAYYYAFPQLIRFFKNENPTKALMDDYYYESLRNLKVKREFVIHTVPKYSEILKLMQRLVEREIELRSTDGDSEIDVEKYLTYMRQMNPNFFIENQSEIFFVSKDKMTNLYHMINRCRVQDFLKMNWLLKIGFSNEAYKIIQKEFYYQTQDKCHQTMTRLTIQELAYMYAYCSVCLEAIQEKDQFKNKKEHPTPFFFSDILHRMKKSPLHSRLKGIYAAEAQSLEIQCKIKQNQSRGIVIVQKEHPSLLDMKHDIQGNTRPPDLPKKQEDFPCFGTIRPKKWKGETSAKKTNLQNEDEYPSLCSVKEKSVAKEEEFPTVGYQPIVVNSKKMKSQKVNQSMGGLVGWGNQSFVPDKWKEDDAASSWQKRMEDEQRRRKKREKQEKLEKMKAESEEYPSLDSGSQAQVQVQPIREPEPEPMVYIKPKKSNLIEEWSFPVNQNGKKIKNKNKNKGLNKTINPSTQKNREEEKISAIETSGDNELFAEIQREEKMVSGNNRGRKGKAQKTVSSTTFTNGVQVKNPDWTYFDKDKVFNINQTGNMVLNRTLHESVFSSQSDEPPVVDQGDFPILPKPAQKSNVKNQQSHNTGTGQKAGNRSKAQSNKVTKPQSNDQSMVSEEKKSITKTKMRYDDTSSDEEKRPKNEETKKIATERQSKQMPNSKKSEQKQEFESIFDAYKKQERKEDKISKVNQLISASSQPQKPENEIVIKKGRKGKKVIIERVNLFG